jgi:hypothetical protein
VTKKDGKNIWELICDCGNKTYSIMSQVTCGKKQSCGCLAKEVKIITASKRGLANRKFSPIISSARKVWRHYKDGCDFESFLKISQLPCHYCNRNPYRIYNISSNSSGYISTTIQSEKGNFIYNGLDRIDSSKNHAPNNIVPCCWDCNDMKKDRSYEEFTHINLFRCKL